MNSLNSEETEILVKSNSNTLSNGKICLAAVTSCTNTSNPSVLIMAGIIAKKAVELGMKIPSWVKTSFAPGSKVVQEYMQLAGLQKFLDKLGFNIVGLVVLPVLGTLDR